VKVLRIETGAPIAPWNDPIGETPVLDTTLREAQDKAIADAGCTLVDAPPPDEPYILLGDRLWFTAETLRRVVRGGPGRLVIDDPGFAEGMHDLQDLGPDDSYDLAHLPAGSAPDLGAVAPRRDDLGLHDGFMPPFNKHMQHALRPVRVGAAMAHHLDHWSHVVRVNQLALVALGEEARFWWDTSGWIPRLWQVVKLLWRAKKLTRRAIFHHLLPVSKEAQIHETAVVEASRVAPGATIGPHAVVRGSVIGPGARIEDSATVNLSSIGANCQVERFGMVNLCVMYPGACISKTYGFQGSVIGRHAFVAQGATGLDMSFGAPIKVRHRGQRVSSGQHFLGVALGHDVVVGNGVRLNYGVDVPNGAVLVAPSHGLIRDASGAEPGVPVRWQEGGGVTPVRRKAAAAAPAPEADEPPNGDAPEG
jgi:acetyltransferase-like isoleucine patch superfamily enzyme